MLCGQYYVPLQAPPPEFQVKVMMKVDVATGALVLDMGYCCGAVHSEEGNSVRMILQKGL